MLRRLRLMTSRVCCLACLGYACSMFWHKKRFALLAVVRDRSRSAVWVASVVAATVVKDVPVDAVRPHNDGRYHASKMKPT
jgi:hypothetical protein